MIGQSLKSYVVEEMLGRGGMGVVYRARDTRLGRAVALKVLPPELMRDEERRRRFIQEARAASAVNHPAIASIYEIEEQDDITFIVMEFVDGSTVHELVKRRELDIPSALEVAAQVADALAQAHAAGIVHRDIKSDNIMVSKDGHPKILDFGLAKLLDVSSGAGGDGASVLETIAKTQSGMILGTVAYMSPEQARGLPADKRSDIFSLGVVLYEMVTGKVPFEGVSALDTMHAIAFAPTRPVTSVRADLPYSLQRVIDRCLQKKPEDRYQDMREVAVDIKSVKREIESGASGGKPMLERARWWFRGLSARGAVWTAIGGAVVGGLVVGLVTSRSGGRVAPLISMAFVGFMVYRHFRRRSHKEMLRFVKKASALREVQVITFNKGQFIVVADKPTAKTYLKLNALLTSANQRLYQGEPMTMVIRENTGEAELHSLLSNSGVQYLRDDQ